MRGAMSYDSHPRFVSLGSGDGKGPPRPIPMLSPDLLSSLPLPGVPRPGVTSYRLVRTDASCAVNWGGGKGGSQSTGSRIPAHSPSRGMCDEIRSWAEANCAQGRPP